MTTRRSNGLEHELESGQLLVNVHDSSECEGQGCVIHHPSDHPLRDAPRQYREDRGFIEQVCKHGIGHPDHDTLLFLWGKHGGRFEELAVHGCDGCCVGQGPP